MSFAVRYTAAARADLLRLYGFLLEKDLVAAERAPEAITRTIDGLKEFPFAARKATGGNAFLREVLIPFGSSGYVALIEIEDAATVTVLALRHQREEDYL